MEYPTDRKITEHQDIKILDIVDLPKWTQCKIIGKQISPEQADEIIRRTDIFFDCYHKEDNWTHSIGPGNNHEFEDKVAKICKMPLNAYSDERKLWKHKWGYIDTEYIHNTFISSSFIFGPYGWVHPDGTIAYMYNIGKYPSVSSVYSDLFSIARNFKFINMIVTLMDGEYAEVNTKPSITFHVHDGDVFITDEPIDMDIDTLYEKMGILYGRDTFGNHTEQTFTLKEIQKWSDKIFNNDNEH